LFVSRDPAEISALNTPPRDPAQERPDWSMIKPIAWRRWTTGSWAMKPITPSTILPDIDHPAADNPIAKHTDPPVVEGRPFAKTVGLLKYRQLILQSNVLVHWGLGLRGETKFRRRSEISPPLKEYVGKLPRTPRPAPP